MPSKPSSSGLAAFLRAFAPLQTQLSKSEKEMSEQRDDFTQVLQWLIPVLYLHQCQRYRFLSLQLVSMLLQRVNALRGDLQSAKKEHAKVCIFETLD